MKIDFFSSYPFNLICRRALRFTFFLLTLMFQATQAADINVNHDISCVSGESHMLGWRVASQKNDHTSPSTKQVLDWKSKERFGDGKSKILFKWTPINNDGVRFRIETTDKPHNLMRIRSRTKSDLIIVSSSSNFLSSESWTFTINFNVEAMVVTRMVSNVAGVGGELISYQCDFTAT